MTPSRETMIARLINDWYDSVASDSETLWHILTNGFKGYANMTDEEVRADYCDANLNEIYAEDEEEENGE